MIIEIIIYIIVGIFSGIITGLLGVGGGIVIVPSLFYLFRFLNIEITDSMHTAIGTSLAIITVASLVAMYLYKKRQAIFWTVFKDLNISLIISSFLGVIVSHLLSNRLLVQIFAVFAFVFGLYLFIVKKMYRSMKKPKKLLVITCGFIIGFLATLLGVGGGVVAVPFFILFLRVPNYSLVGTAAATTFITAAIGTISYIIAGFNKINNPNSFSYIYLPAFLIISFISIFSVFIGIKLADRIHLKLLKRIFGASLIATAIFIFFK